MNIDVLTLLSLQYFKIKSCFFKL